jgi:ankyrin repeat protein
MVLRRPGDRATLRVVSQCEGGLSSPERTLLAAPRRGIMTRACDQTERSRMLKGQKPPSKTAMFDAAKAWDLGEVQALVKASPQLAHATDARGRTALHLACAVKPGSRMLGEPHGIKTVTALLEAGSGLEVAVPMDADEGDFRATPLWYAVARGENLPLVLSLLKRGADASSSLWAAVWRDDDVLCRHLLKSQPRLNLRAHGETPIFYAARLRRLKTLGLLIEAAANPAIADRQGRDAVEIAQARRLPKDVVCRLADLRRRFPDASVVHPALDPGHPAGA